MVDNSDILKKNIATMNSLEGFDVVIVCCSSQKQANYWQKRLEDGRGSIMPLSSIVLAVQEDWPGGAGNALGTLYAYKNAVALGIAKYNINIEQELKAGKISVGLYHTAGKGTRLAPLPGAENNNKPGVKVPATIKLANNARVSITILEAVVKQTGCYAKSRLGRLSVFWGDQVFVPTVPVEYTITHHVDILCSLGPTPSEAEWKEKGMDKYGLIAQSVGGEAAQVEKVDHATAVQLLSSLGEIKSVGVSLGSFSVSAAMLLALNEEFRYELENRIGKLDSDPHLWMPMSLSKASYLHLMEQKKIPEEVSSPHFDRIEAFVAKFRAVPENATVGLFGPVDVGQGVLWWDYGQLKLFQKNALLATSSNDEASLMRLFYGLDEHQIVDSTLQGTAVSEGSCVSASQLTGGFIKGSALTGVRAHYIEAEEAILVNVTADRIIAGKGSIVYNVVAPDNSLTVAPGQVLAGVFSDDGSYHIVRSDISIDGGKAWETVLADLGNKHSFEQVYNLNADACPLTLERVISEGHSTAWEKISKVTSAFGSRKTSAKLDAVSESEKRPRVGLSEIEN